MAVQFVAGPLTTPTNRADVDVTAISGFRPVEPTIIVNPADPANIVVSSHNGLRLSANAGGTFSGTFFFTNPAGTNQFNGDTDLIFDSQGRLFWANLAGTGGMGLSFNEIDPVTGANISVVSVANNGDDKEFITADQTIGSPFQDNLYMVWTSFNGGAAIRFSRSVDQGVTWSAPVTLSAAADGFPWPSDVGVAPNGDVYIAYHAQGTFNGTGDLGGNPNGTTGQIIVRRSTDGGVTFGAAVAAFPQGDADITFNIQNSPGSIAGTRFWMQGSAQPWVLADPARAGNVYIITADDPDNVHGTAGDDIDIVIARSTDNGQTWTRATLPVNPPGGSHQFFPTAAIDERGNIVVVWYDSRNGGTNAAGNMLLDVFATYSTDGGVTWATPFQLNDAAFDPDIGAGNRTAGPPATTRIGEYFGVDIFGGTAYVAWVDSNAGTGQQTVRYSSFAIAGSITVTGDDAGVTSDAIEIGNIATNTDSMEVLVNGDRQYAGLVEALSGGITVNGLGGDDTIAVRFTTTLDTNLTIDGGQGSDTARFQTALDLGDSTLAVTAETIEIDGGAISAGLQTYTGNVRLGDNTTITSANDNAITFAGKIDSDGIAWTLAVMTAGDTILNGNVGDVVPLAALTTGGGGRTIINAASVRTSGDQTYGDAVVLGQAAVLTADDVRFQSTVDNGGHLLTVNVSGTDSIAQGAISGAGGLTKSGGGRFTLAASNTYSGLTSVVAGLLLVNGSTAADSDVVVSGTGTLGGDGTVGGDVTVLAAGAIAPGVDGPGSLATGNVAFSAGSSFVVQVDGTAAVLQDQLLVTGSVSLGGAALHLDVGYTASPADRFKIIDNDGVADAVVGQFDQLDEQGIVVDGTNVLLVSYADGDGNDVVLTYLSGQIDNVVTGTVGNDKLNGSQGNDLIVGLAGDDHLVGNSGDDVLVGGAGNDQLIGNHGNDFLLGGSGNDKLQGNEGDDILLGGQGDDDLKGGSGADTFIFSGLFGNDTITGFQDGADVLDISAFAALMPGGFAFLDTNIDGLVSDLDDRGAWAKGALTIDLTFAGPTGGTITLQGVAAISAADLHLV